MSTDRRGFLAASAATAAGLASPGLAAPAVRGRGSLQDVEHVVVLMQENRSFDHYFGSLRGVRGFGDPRPVRLPDGSPVWNQRQRPQDGGQVVLPFRLDTANSAAGCLKSLDHSWRGDYDRWKHYDVWMPDKEPMSMGHMTRADLPYYYALADQFTICDAYHCSIHGPTGPNRLYLFSGTNGLSAGSVGPWNVDNTADDNPGADMARDDPRWPGYAWTPYAARLEAAGVGWRVYQEVDNFSDNPLGYFPHFRKLDPASSKYRRGRAWVEGSPTVDIGHTRADHLVAAFARDVAADRLPAVSWIVAPQHMSEHPDAPPAYGQTLTARLVAALASNPEVWRKSVFILNYDENDGFFDHQPPPTPATRPELGASTVDLRGETYGGQPVGLGPRVPCLIVSPWTRGGWVDSQVFDHTSVLRLLEARFGVRELNITPWRRAVCGDLLSAFDFDVGEAARRDTSWLSALPDTAPLDDAEDARCRLPAARRPDHLVRARQETGGRPARALPYDLDVVASRRDDALALAFVNRGAVGAVFTVRQAGGAQGPWSYTVDAGRTLEAQWRPAAPTTAHDLVVDGPNGFHRALREAGEATHRPDARLVYDRTARVLRLEVANPGARAITLQVASKAPGGPPPQSLTLAPGENGRLLWPAADPAGRWYDLTVAAPGFERRFAGHVETREPGVSEPALSPA